MNVRERIILRTVVDENNCWLWMGAMSQKPGGNYPYMKVDGRSRPVTRVVYEQCVGVIPPKHEVHHVCHVTECVNPSHLQAVLKAAHQFSWRY